MSVRVVFPSVVDTRLKWKRMEVYCYEAPASRSTATRKIVFENRSIEDIASVLRLTGVHLELVESIIRYREITLFVRVLERGKCYEVEKILENPEVWEFHNVMEVL